MIAGRSLFFVVAMYLLISACATTLHVLDDETTKTMLPWLEDQPTKSVVLAKLGNSWKYSDSSGKIIVYSMIKERDTLELWKHPGDLPTHELVLVFDENEHLKRYSLIKLN